MARTVNWWRPIEFRAKSFQQFLMNLQCTYTYDTRWASWDLRKPELNCESGCRIWGSQMKAQLQSIVYHGFYGFYHQAPLKWSVSLGRSIKLTPASLLSCSNIYICVCVYIFLERDRFYSNNHNDADQHNFLPTFGRRHINWKSKRYLS